MEESRSTPDSREERQAQLKLEKNAIVSVLIKAIWEAFQKSRASNPSGLLTKKLHGRFVSYPPNYFNAMNAEWASLFGFRPGQHASGSSLLVPGEFDFSYRSLVSGLYEDALFTLQNVCDEWFKAEGEQPFYEPTVKRLSAVLKEWHRYSRQCRWPETPHGHVMIGLNTSCDVSYGLIEVTDALTRGESLEKVATVLRHPKTLMLLRSLASLSINQLDAFIDGVMLRKDYPTRQGLEAPYRKVLNPNGFSTEDGHLKLLSHDFRRTPLDPHFAPHTGCPVLKSGDVLKEMWTYFVDLYVAARTLQDSSIRERVKLKLAAKASDTTLANVLMKERSRVRFALVTNLGHNTAT